MLIIPFFGVAAQLKKTLELIPAYIHQLISLHSGYQDHGFMPAVLKASNSALQIPERAGVLRFPQYSHGRFDIPRSNTPPKTDEEKSLTLIYDTLQAHLKQNEPYRNSRYTLQDFSLETSVPGYLISRAVNHCYGSSFTNWINYHRVDCFLKMLMKNWKPGINLYELSLQAGFASKTAFINSFKRETGVTPGAYVRRVIRPSVISALK